MDAHVSVVEGASLSISPSRVYVGEPMTFFVNATSTDLGATIHITIYFDYFLSDGVTPNPSSPVFSVDVVGAPANVTTIHTYDHIGNITDDPGTYFQVRALISDGETTSLRSAKAYVVTNTAPSLLSKPPSTIYPLYEVPYNMSYIVKDWDTELVTVTWNFGDGTDPVVNETIATPTGSSVHQNHTWVVVLEPGRDARDSVDPYYILFNMSVSFVDAFGNVKYSNHTVTITPPDNFEPSFNFTARSSFWSPGYELPFSASASDSEGDPITWTFVFNNSVEDYLIEVYHSDPTEPDTVVWQNVTHVFSSVGIYNVTLFISDALPPYQVRSHNISQTLMITVSNNTVPGVLANISVAPTTPRINVTLGYAEVTFSIQANDPDGDVLSLSWDFGNGGSATNESAGGKMVYTFIQKQRYNVSGQYNVSVIVDDSRGHAILRYKLISILTNNSGPVLRLVDFDLSNGTSAMPGSTINVTLVIADAEQDTLTVWVDFGDNSSTVMIELTEFSLNNSATVTLSHIYNDIGTYNVTITYTDGFFGPSHNVTVVLPVEVKIPRIVTIRHWDYWDYISLALFNIGIALIFVRWFIVGRFRKDLDKKGTSLEEYRIISKELKMRRNSFLEDIDLKVKQGNLDPKVAKERKAEIRARYVKDRDALQAGTLSSIDEGV